jgi:hypothetical protein
MQFPIELVPEFSGMKRMEGDADHSPPSKAGAKNKWSYTFTPFIRLHRVDREKLYILSETWNEFLTSR